MVVPAPPGGVSDNWTSMSRVRTGLEVVRTSHGRRWLWRNAYQRIYSSHIAIGVRRDLNVPHDPGPARIPLVVRQLQPGDDLSLIADDPGLTQQAAEERATQRWLLSSDLPAPWVAVDSEGVVLFMVWMLMAQDNGRIRAVFGKMLPELKPDEAIIEGPFSAQSHRGLRVMHASQQIVESAREFGVRYVMGFISETNIPQLTVAHQGAFYPFAKRELRWFLYRMHVRFFPLSEDDKVELRTQLEQH
jgi:hypothetical protein